MHIVVLDGDGYCGWATAPYLSLRGHTVSIDDTSQPHLLSDSLLDSLVNVAVRYRDRIDSSLFLPRVDWRRPRNDRRLTPVDAAEARP
jgi:nucleoside-diphosphate-sugar epimerase